MKNDQMLETYPPSTVSREDVDRAITNARKLAGKLNKLSLYDPKARQGPRHRLLKDSGELLREYACVLERLMARPTPGGQHQFGLNVHLR